jgi:hypothetical protein
METIQKKRLHHLWTKIRVIRIEYLMVAFVCMLFVTVLALRHNNQQMLELRQAVFAADEKNSDVEGALRELRQYIYAHMNTDLDTGKNSVYPPIQLQQTYTRLLAAQQESAKQANQQIYTEAQSYCEKLHPESFSGGPRVPCIRDYVASKGVQLPTIPDSLYKFDFVSPRWSSDFAGWSLLATVLLGALLLVRAVIPLILKILRVI